MRIVHLIFSLEIGGAELMLVDILNKQSQSHDVCLIIINSDVNTSLLKRLSKNIRLFMMDRTPGSIKLFPIVKLNFILRFIKPHILHCHNDDIFRLLFFQKNTLICLTAHTVGLSKKWLSKYKVVFSISKSVADDIKLRTGIESPVVLNGIDFDSIKRKKNYKNNLQNNYKILQVSRLDHAVKGQDILIKAFRILKDEFPNIIFNVDFIGEGESIVYLKELAQSLGMSDDVNFLGLKGRDYIYTHLADYDLLVQPSTSEGFGLTVVEGMVAGIPVLVSNIDGPMEIIANGSFGFFFESGNKKDLARMIAKILIEENKIQWQDWCNKVRDYALENYDISKTAEKYIEWYEMFS